MKKVKDDQYRLGKDRYDQSLNPSITGMISQPIYSDLFSTNQSASGEFISPLSGQKIADMKHNNMQPFLKGNITQNTNVERFTSKLERDTGNDRFYMKKREVESIFKPISGLNNINGARQYTDFLKSRIEPSKINNNISPMEKIYVGPGLNKGYTSRGSGGFQQSDTLEYSRPKTLDDLRSKVNQRETIFQIPFQAPVKGTEQRGVAVPYAKNKPERTYAQDENNWFKTTGAVVKDTVRSPLVIKEPTDLHTEYQGPAKLENVKGMATDDDYGKKNIIVYNNEREKTQICTPVANLTTNVKALLTPVVDALRLSLKEYLVDAARAGGNAQAQVPNKPTVYDPTDTPKTTVKETTVADSDQLNLTGPSQSYSAAQDEAKTTVKETLIHDGDVLNVKSNTCSYMKNDDNAKTTVKETLPVVDTKRNIGAAVYKVYVYDPDLAAKTTTKQTTIKGKSEMGFLGGLINSMLGGYASADVELKSTHKQFTSDNYDYGIAKAIYEFKQTSREAENNAEIDGARERLLIDAGHTPNPGNMNIPIDKTDISMQTNRLVTDDFAEREAGNLNRVYQLPPKTSEDNFTREPVKSNAFEDRLDSTILAGLKTNDLSIKINPI
jgi:hypothetical protein